MYTFALYLHSYTRWLVLLSMIWALWRMWQGLLTGREWARQDRVAGFTFAMATSVQFILGVVLYGAEGGMARAALVDFAAAMKVRELRFFGLEHPLQMTIALTLSHIGSARARRATTTRNKFRWGAICFTITALLILSAIPWWRPLLRLPASVQSVPAVLTVDDLPEGDAANGAILYEQGADGANACRACHSLTDERLVGPGFAGVYERAGSRVAGQTAETYLQQSIVEPAAHLVDGYANIMPPDYGELFSAQELADLIAFLKSLEQE